MAITALNCNFLPKNHTYYYFDCDRHLYGADPIKDKIFLLGERSFILGDCLDLKNCLQEEYSDALKSLEFLKKAFGERYLDGNHECLKSKDRIIEVTAKTLALHGDLLCYGAEKSIEARNDKHCSGGKGKRLLKRIGSKYRNNVNYKASKCLKDKTFMKELASIMAKYPNANKALIGHTHIHEVTKVRINKNFEVWFLPRGTTSFSAEQIEN